MDVLVVSNGHGEDLIGSRLAVELLRATPALAVWAFPLVGAGSAYRSAGLEVRGSARPLPSGGLTMHSPAHLFADLRAGLLSDLFRQFGELRRQKPAATIVVGDIWALTLSLLTAVPAEQRFVLQTLVSVRSDDGRFKAPHRLFMERITIPERALQRRFTARVWLRDATTAAWLREAGVKQADYAGSFLFDEPPRREVTGSDGTVLLLPGSRSWASDSLRLLLPLAELLSDRQFTVSWAGPCPPQLPPGWHSSHDGTILQRGPVTVELQRGRFNELLSEAAVAVGTAGTALEQAAAAGIPCLSFALPGRHTRAFLANQQRLLRGALHVAPAAEPAQLARELSRLLSDDGARSAAARAGREVLGAPGGLKAIARTIAGQLSVS